MDASELVRRARVRCRTHLGAGPSLCRECLLEEFEEMLLEQYPEMCRGCVRAGLGVGALGSASQALATTPPQRQFTRPKDHGHTRPTETREQRRFA